MKSIIAIMLFLFFTGYSHADAECAYEYDEAGNVLGMLYSVDVSGSPGTSICGQWFEDGLVALAPNVDIEMGPYCREVTLDGYITFAYRDRYLLDCAQLTSRMEFRVTW